MGLSYSWFKHSARKDRINTPFITYILAGRCCVVCSTTHIHWHADAIHIILDSRIGGDYSQMLLCVPSSYRSFFGRRWKKAQIECCRLRLAIFFNLCQFFFFPTVYENSMLNTIFNLLLFPFIVFFVRQNVKISNQDSYAMCFPFNHNFNWC